MDAFSFFLPYVWQKYTDVSGKRKKIGKYPIRREHKKATANTLLDVSDHFNYTLRHEKSQ